MSILKGLSSLKQMESARSRRDMPLPTLDNRKDSPTFSFKPESKCAFHVQDKITNFCRDPNCLLPLCPKCIQIHSQEHMELGTPASFEPIENCMKQAHIYFVNIFQRIDKLQKASSDVEDAYRKKKEQMLRDFSDAQQLAYRQLGKIFKQYESAFLEELDKQDGDFTAKLIQYHDAIAEVLDNTRNCCHKFSNRQLTMEGLITFYAQEDTEHRLQELSEKLSTFTASKMQLRVEEKQLENFGVVIQRYLRVGDSTNTFLELMERGRDSIEARMNSGGTEARMNSIGSSYYGDYIHNGMDTYYMNNGKQTYYLNNGKGSYLSRQREEPLNIPSVPNIYDDIRIDSSLKSFGSALNNFNLKKSREIRRHLKSQSQQKKEDNNWNNC